MYFKIFDLFLCLMCPISIVTSTLSASDTKKNRSVTNSKSLMIISTVDGKVSALDLKNEGKLLWSVEIDGPLVSQSITKLSYEQDGRTIRLIPSLHGGLYKFDGDAVEAVPFDAEQLVHSSFRLADNSVLVGGKDTAFTGIDGASGKILYTCNVKGCAQQQSSQDTSDIFVVKRLQQTVRSIENRHGLENWNFSVGEIDIEFLRGSNALLLTGSSDQPIPNTQDYYDQQNAENHFETSDISRIKFAVPDGTVCMVTPTNKQLILWKHKFSSAIAAAWILSESKLVKINMFDSTKVPALGKDNAQSLPSSDVIFMGIYEKQIYIQASPSVQQAVSQGLRSHVQTSVTQIKYNPLRFTHRTCPSSKYLTLSGTEAVSSNSKDTSLVVLDSQDIVANSLGKHLTLCHDDPKFKKGFYFQGDLSIYSRIQKSNRRGRHTITSDEVITPQKPLNLMKDSSLKVFIFTLVLMIFVPYIFYRYVHALYLKEPAPNELPTHYDANDTANVTGSVEGEYESRFLSDFEPEKCLGRGGFGVVFKAKNKMDDCSYAVKRILLPQNDFSRNKVLREVRALAQLDHPSIVRYFNSWSEQPPLGWQEEKDKKLIQDISAWSSLNNHTTSHQYKFEVHDSTKRGHKSKLQLSNIITNEIDVSNKNAENLGNNVTSSSEGFIISNYDKMPKSLIHGHDSCLTSWDTNDKYEEHENDNFKGKFFEGNSSSSNNSSLDQNKPLPFQHYQDPSLCIEFTEGAKMHIPSTKPNHKYYDETFVSDNPSNLCNLKPDGSDQRERQEVEHSEDKNSTVYLYIQMQLCREDSLKEWLTNHLRDRQTIECIGIFHQVVSAVEYIHERELIHRDLKPSNVLFSLNGTIKVGDFGLVTHASELPTESTASHNSSRKQHTRHVGTMLYMAPEQMKSGNYTDKVDIFALGLILFELFYPFNTQMEKVKHFANVRKFMFPLKFERDFPKESALIKSMLHQHADLRPTAQSVKNNELFNSK